MKTSPSQLNEDDVLKLEKTLDYHFVNRGLLLRALTHSSYANEYGLESAHNERQEFLGDAVLELCVSWELYKRFPNTREGDLTRLRSSLVNTTSFACRAREIGLDKMLFLGRGEESQGRFERRFRGSPCSRLRGRGICGSTALGSHCLQQDLARGSARGQEGAGPQDLPAGTRAASLCRGQACVFASFRDRPEPRATFHHGGAPARWALLHGRGDKLQEGRTGRCSHGAGGSGRAGLLIHRKGFCFGGQGNCPLFLIVRAMPSA